MLSTQLLKEGPHVADEQVRCCLVGKVVAPVIDMPGDDILAVAFREVSDRLEDISKVAQSKRDGGGFSWQWNDFCYSTSPQNPDVILLPRSDLSRFADIVCSSA